MCIPVGKFHWQSDEIPEFKVKSYAGDECEVLCGFARALGETKLCGTKPPKATHFRQHDAPGALAITSAPTTAASSTTAASASACSLYGQPLPPLLDLAGCKSWDLPRPLNTMDLWKFGDFKGTVSLPPLAGAFGIPSLKDDLDGSQVEHPYWAVKDLARIMAYYQ